MEAIEPDNVTPSWLRVRCRALVGLIECEVELPCDSPERILSLRNTIEDLLISLRASMEAVGETSI